MTERSAVSWRALRHSEWAVRGAQVEDLVGRLGALAIQHRRRLAIAIIVSRVVLLSMYVAPATNPSSEDETALTLRYVAESQALGLAAPSMQAAQGLWHLPLAYVVWARVLRSPATNLLSGRLMAAFTWGVAWLVWWMLVRNLIPPRHRLLAAASFCLLDPSSAIHLRPYGLYLLEGLLVAFASTALVSARSRLAVATLGVALAVSLALLMLTHVYGFVAGLALAMASLFARRARPSVAFAMVAGTLAATAAAAPALVELVASHRAVGSGLGVSSAHGESTVALLRRACQGTAIQAAVFASFVPACLSRRRPAAAHVALGLLSGGFPFALPAAWLMSEPRPAGGDGLALAPILALGVIGCSVRYPVFFPNYVYPYEALLLFVAVVCFADARAAPRLVGTVYLLCRLGGFVLSTLGSVLFGRSVF